MDSEPQQNLAKLPLVLVVEDEPIIALDIENSLEKLGFQVLGTAQTGQQALDMTSTSSPDLVLMDIRLPGRMDGITAATLIRDRWDIPVVFLTAHTDADVMSRAGATSAYGFLTKPFRVGEMNGTIRLALHRHQLTRALLQEHAWFTTLLGSLSDGVIATDVEARVRYINPAAEEMIGWSQQDAIGKLIEEVYPLANSEDVPLERCQLRKALATRQPVGKERFCATARNGSKLSVEDSATPILDKGRLLGAVTIFQDITQREQAEHVLRESEKLAIVGRLASSISHEINNPLEAITNLLYLSESNLPAGSPVLSYVQQANEELGRITHITTETLRFHRQSTHPLRVQLTDILDSVLALHQGRLRNLQIEIVKQYRPCCALVVFANEVRQVLANLVGNAVDAMASSTTRRLTLKVCNSRDWRTGRPGVRISVADTGSGMSVATMNRLFKPFFTTKAATSTGLGLWVSAGIVEKHGGRIQFRSSQAHGNHGTVFSVFFPSQAD